MMKRRIVSNVRTRFPEEANIHLIDRYLKSKRRQKRRCDYSGDYDEDGEWEYVDVIVDQYGNIIDVIDDEEY